MPLCLSSSLFIPSSFLNPYPSADDPVLAEEPVTAFAMIFRPQFWWFEIYNMFRRLMLTCAVLLCANLAQTVVFVLLVAVVTLVIEQESKAYVNQFLSSFTAVCCWQVLLFILFLLLVGGGSDHHRRTTTTTATTTTTTYNSNNHHHHRCLTAIATNTTTTLPSWTRSLPVATRPPCSRRCSAWQT